VETIIEDVAERRFSWLAGQRGCRFWREHQLEEVIAVRGPRPDFFVRSAAADFLAEVKSFVEPGPLDGRDRVFSTGFNQMMRPISGAIDEAARQLRAYRDEPMARVVVLDNWRQTGIDLDDVFLLQIFGELHFVVPVVASVGEPTRETTLAYGGGRTIGLEKGTFISAVMVVEPLARDADDAFVRERPMRARVVHNPYATVPLSRAIFNSECDAQLYHDGRAWQKTQGVKS
jgi:hypothetical protein